MVARKTNDKVNSKGDSVLEIGCNQGQILHLLRSDINYTGIDVAEKCITKALKKHQDRPSANFSVINGENSQFQNNSFDSIILAHVLSVTPNPNALLQESYRILKPGGTVYIVNHFSDSHFFKTLNSFCKKLSLGVDLYFPFNVVIQSKGFNIVKQKKINFFWTYVELKKT